MNFQLRKCCDSDVIDYNMLISCLSAYNAQSNDEYQNALKQIIQQITLLGLWRAKFFEHAAFYGGTALF